MALLRSYIHKALARQLNENFSQSAYVIWENVHTEMTLNQTYFAEMYMPTDTEPRTLGSVGETEDYGFYQINIYTPINTSTIQTEAYIEELSILYKPGTHLIESGVDVLIERATPSQGFKLDNWYVTPLRISWSCYLPIY